MARKVGLVHSLVESSKKGIRHIVTMELELGAICIGYPPPRAQVLSPKLSKAASRRSPGPTGGRQAGATKVLAPRLETSARSEPN
jgi:hypothetical protein